MIKTVLLVLVAGLLGGTGHVLLSKGMKTIGDLTEASADRVGGITHPLGRVGDGVEVGRVVAFAASDEASWVTGTDIAVDGGFSSLGPDQGIAARGWFEGSSG